MADQLPPAVKQFLAQHIRSVEQLEVLLLLHGQASRAWTAAEVYEVIRSSASSIADRLSEFTKAGFLVEENPPASAFRFAPRSTDLRSAVDQTAVAYRTWRIRVIEAIFAPDANPVQTFADAFKLRKDG